MPLYFLLDEENNIIAYDRLNSKKATFLNKRIGKKGKRWATSEKIVEEYLARSTTDTE